MDIFKRLVTTIIIQSIHDTQLLGSCRTKLFSCKGIELINSLSTTTSELIKPVNKNAQSHTYTDNTNRVKMIRTYLQFLIFKRNDFNRSLLKILWEIISR